MRPIALVALLLVCQHTASTQLRLLTPGRRPAPVGPYSSGIIAGAYLYVSGQGALTPDGTMPAFFPDLVRQTLENVKAIVEAGGLTMEHVVNTQVYLEDITRFAEINRVYAEYFPKSPPVRHPVRKRGEP